LISVLISVLMFGGNHLSIRHHGYWTSMMHSLVLLSFSAGHPEQKKRKREREREGKEERNNEEAISVRTDPPLGTNDITRPRNATSSRCDTHSLSPTARFRRISRRISPLGVLLPPPSSPRSRGSAESGRATARARGRRAFLHETTRRLFGVSSRVHTASERTRRSEAKRGRDPSGWRCESPNALRACGFRYPGLSGEDKKASLERG